MDFTESVLNAYSNIENPRLKFIVSQLIKHVHTCIKEMRPTDQEFEFAWDFMERIEITSRADYEKQAASGSKEFLDLLYTKYLDRSKTVALWSELIDP